MSEPLTAAEHEAMDLLAELSRLMGSVIGQGTTRSPDMGEAITLIHGLQNMVLSQAAARAYPERYRLLGESFAPKDGAA